MSSDRRLQCCSKLGRGQGVGGAGPAHPSVPICKDSQKQRASFGGAAREATCSSDSPELIPALLNLVLFDPDAAGYMVIFAKVMNHCLMFLFVDLHQLSFDKKKKE